MLVDIRDLRAGYGAKTVVSVASLRIAKGEHTLLLGPSGCGKTTLLNVMAGIASPLAGQVRINGILIGDLTVSQRDRFRGRHIGLVMQRLHLISALTIITNLRLAQRLADADVDDARILGTLEKLGVADKLHRYPRELSHGEAQRVAIARAVVNRPALILADEPTSSLDDRNCLAAIELLFAQAGTHGATLIVATHDARIRPRFQRVVALGLEP